MFVVKASGITQKLTSHPFVQVSPKNTF